jgi:uncharacterized cupredoxin-like copper-binding protein
MGDTMRFSPTTLSVKQGETRAVSIVRNDGKLLHEMVLGTHEELAKHAELMRKFPDMEHDEPHMVHVQPGRTEAWCGNSTAGEFRVCMPGAGTLRGRNDRHDHSSIGSLSCTPD